MRLRCPQRPALIFYGAFWVAVMACLSIATIHGLASPTATVTVAGAYFAVVKTDPKTVVGATKCLKCHKAEHAQWMKTVHYTNHKRLTSPNAVKYGKTLGIAQADIATSSMCINCHATPQDKGGKPQAIAGVGVSCESCHGGAGGKNGWLEPHGIYGPKGTTRKQETAAHRKTRFEDCRKAGKVGPHELYGVAKKCYSCHIVGNEKLVKAGHEAGSLGFEFASWSNGEVRHNFQLDQTKNAPVSSLWLNPVGDADKGKRVAANRRRKMFVLGLMVNLETSLRNRGNATDAVYARKMAARIRTMQRKLGRINVVETKAVAALIPPRAVLRAVKPGQKKIFDAAADKVSKAIIQFLKKHDGSKLGGLDAMIPKAHFSKEYKQ